MSARELSFAVRPKWIAGHILAIVAIVVFVSMGFWQLRRLAERQEFNSLITSRTTVAEQPLDDVLTEYGRSQDDLELRIVVAQGQYLPDDEIILRARSYNGLSGHHVLTPLDLGDGRSIVIDRGWVSIDLDSPGMAEFAATEGPVTVYGALRKTETRGSFGPVDPPTGVLAQMARVDLERIDQQVETEVLPVYIQLLDQDPAPQTDRPALVALPTPSEGPHRGYAVQWFLFAGVVAVGYPVLLWRTSSELPSTPSSGS